MSTEVLKLSGFSGVFTRGECKDCGEVKTLYLPEELCSSCNKKAQSSEAE